MPAMQPTLKHVAPVFCCAAAFHHPLWTISSIKLNEYLNGLLSGPNYDYISSFTEVCIDATIRLSTRDRYHFCIRVHAVSKRTAASLQIRPLVRLHMH